MFDLFLISGLLMLAIFYKLFAIKARARLAKDREKAASDEILSYEALLREEVALWGGGDIHVDWSTSGTDVRVAFVTHGLEFVVEGTGRSRGQAIAAALIHLSRERLSKGGRAGAENPVDESAAIGARWWEILGVGPDADLRAVERSYRALAKRHHPDRGGSHEMMGRINLARDEAKLALGA